MTVIRACAIPLTQKSVSQGGVPPLATRATGYRDTQSLSGRSTALGDAGSRSTVTGLRSGRGRVYPGRCLGLCCYGLSGLKIVGWGVSACRRGSLHQARWSFGENFGTGHLIRFFPVSVASPKGCGGTWVAPSTCNRTCRPPKSVERMQCRVRWLTSLRQVRILTQWILADDAERKPAMTARCKVRALLVRLPEGTEVRYVSNVGSG